MVVLGVEGGGVNKRVDEVHEVVKWENDVLSYTRYFATLEQDGGVFG